MLGCHPSEFPIIMKKSGMRRFIASLTPQVDTETDELSYGILAKRIFFSNLDPYSKVNGVASCILLTNIQPYLI